MIKYLLLSSKLFIFYNSKNFYISLFPVDTLRIERYIYFRDVKTDGLFFYFLTNDSKIIAINPENGNIKSEFKIKALFYSYSFDITSKGYFYFLIKKGGIFKVLKIKFSPFDSIRVFFNLKDKIHDFFVLKDSFFVFISDKNIHIYKGKERVFEIKGGYKNYFKYKGIFYVYKGDTLYRFDGTLKGVYTGDYELLYKGDKGYFIFKRGEWEYIEK